MTSKTKAALRMTALAAMVAIGGMTAGCSDNDDGGPDGVGAGGGGGGGGAGGSGAAVSFGGASGPARAAAEALSLSSVAASAAAVAPGVVPKSAAKAAPCSTGSLTNRASSSGTNANVPFAGASGSSYDLGGADFTGCVIAATSGNNGGINVDSKTLINGPITTGAATGLAFVSIGDSDAKPLDYIIDIKSSGTAGGQSFNATSKVTLSQFYRFDVKSITGGAEQQLFSIFKFKAESTGSSGGQSGSGGATGLVRYGKSLADRFKFVSDASGFTMNGSYFYDLTSCSGEVAVETLQPLTVSAAGLSAGQLKLTSGGRSVTVNYENGGVVYNKGQSDERVFTQQEAAQAAAQNGCAGALALTPAAALAYLP